MSHARELVMTQGVAASYDYSRHFSNDVVTYAMTVAPSGMTFDVNTGILSGTPDTGGGSPLLSATNANGETTMPVTSNYLVVAP